jgi:hypothetical protein
MSVLVIPLALICGPIRGIPFWWRMIDCSFGIFCLPPLLFALWKIRLLEKENPDFLYVGKRAEDGTEDA